MVARAMAVLVPTNESAPDIISLMHLTNYGPKGILLSSLLKVSPVAPVKQDGSHFRGISGREANFDKTSKYNFEQFWGRFRQIGQVR